MIASIYTFFKNLIIFFIARILIFCVINRLIKFNVKIVIIVINGFYNDNNNSIIY